MGGWEIKGWGVRGGGRRGEGTCHQLGELGVRGGEERVGTGETETER
jgi:hypothetical protein